ncbi:MAG: ABC transporter ATP-binding protein [Promethearchaeota archaeon]
MTVAHNNPNKSNSTPVLSVRELVKIYQMGEVEIRALNGVTFDVYKGEFVSLMGTSGSGKTTLLNLIGGLDSITSGSIIIDGVNLAEMTDKELTTIRRHKMGFIFQFFNLIPVLSAWDNVELMLKVLKIEKKERKQRVENTLKSVGLGDRMHNKPDQLSGGQQQRVAIARALAVDPSLILADEATGNLDSKTSENIMEILVNLNKKYNKTIIMVTHDRHIAEYASKILHMHDGKIVKEEKLR